MSGPVVEHGSHASLERVHVTGPVEDREVVVLLLGVAMAAFMLNHLARLKAQTGWQLLLAAVFSVVLGWAVSVVEHFVAIPGADIAEHGLYALHSSLLLAWVIVSGRPRRTS